MEVRILNRVSRDCLPWLALPSAHRGGPCCGHVTCWCPGDPGILHLISPREVSQAHCLEKGHRNARWRPQPQPLPRPFLLSKGSSKPLSLIEAQFLA